MKIVGIYRKSWIGIPINIFVILFTYLLLPGLSVFSKPYTPDSQFYLSLGIYGEKVTSRAPWPAYYWTKTSLIAPLHLLISAFGVVNGFQLLKILFLVTLTTPIVIFFYKKFHDNFMGLALASVVTLNSVVITYLGNTYATIIGLVLLIALQIIIFNHVNSQRMNLYLIIDGFFLGVILSTLLFGNPTYFVIGGIIVATFIFWLMVYMRTKLPSAFRMLGLGSLSFVLTTFAWLQVSSKMFPGMNWWNTVIFYLKILGARDTASPHQLKIFLSNPSLYLIAALQIMGFIILWLGPKRVSQSLSISSFFLTICNLYFLFLLILTGSNFLEVDWYNALLWAPGLVFFILLLAELLETLGQSVLILITLVTTYLSGKWLSGISNEFLMRVFCLTFIIICVLLIFITFESRKILNTWILIPLIFSMICIPQVLQASHLYPYGTAYSSYSLKNYFKVFSGAEGYVLDQTSAKDRVMVWVEPNTDLVGFAAAQLWGPNSVGQGAVLSDEDRTNFKASSPTSIAAYFVDPSDLKKFLNSLRSSGWKYSDQRCSNFKATEISKGFTICLYKVNMLN